MRVLHAVAELYPWVKTGGLGDVAAALPPALAREGAEVRLVLPGFSAFLDAFAGIADVARLATPFAPERVRLLLTRLPEEGGLVYLVDHPAFFDRPGGPYHDPSARLFADNHRRFALFSSVAAALAAGADREWRPQILHAHDWHAGLAAAYLAARPSGEGTAATLFTVHNLAYQGLFPAASFPELYLPSGFFALDGLEFFGQVSFLKAGLVFADRLSTVSPGYAREIQTPAFGAGLDGLLRQRAGCLTGILNGLDPRIWDPRRDPNLPQNYGGEDAPAGKRAAKRALQRRLHLEERAEGPLFGVVSRLIAQKGQDLVLECVPQLVAGGAGLALLGTGDGALEEGFRAAARAAEGRVGVEIGYDEALSHLVIGGADILLMPSRFEPCGLTQLYALRYGTLPLVRRVGGLADTVVDAAPEAVEKGEATGFVFDGEGADALGAAIDRALLLFREPESWRKLMRRAMTRDFTWAQSAQRYLALYRRLLAEQKRPDRA
jgi:starch synthase